MLMFEVLVSHLHPATYACRAFRQVESETTMSKTLTARPGTSRGSIGDIGHAVGTVRNAVSGATEAVTGGVSHAVASLPSKLMPGHHKRHQSNGGGGDTSPLNGPTSFPGTTSELPHHDKETKRDKVKRLLKIGGSSKSKET
jgi:hypothetical protein